MKVKKQRKSKYKYRPSKRQYLCWQYSLVYVSHSFGLTERKRKKVSDEKHRHTDLRVFYTSPGRCVLSFFPICLFLRLQFVALFGEHHCRLIGLSLL